MKATITNMFMALFGVALLVGVLAKPVVQASSANNGFDGDLISVKRFLSSLSLSSLLFSRHYEVMQATSHTTQISGHIGLCGL